MAQELYSPLNAEKHEIRIVKFIEPGSQRPELVHCSLVTVSLDDLRPEYSKFRDNEQAKFSFPLNEEFVAKLWTQKMREESPLPSRVQQAPEEAASSEAIAHLQTPCISRWRYDVHHNVNRASKNLIATLGLQIAEPSLIMREDWAKVDHPNTETMNIVPRFNWGDYETISYCWESDVRNSKVVVNDVTLSVPKSLYLLLRRIQHLPEAKSGMGFWVDGLCIHQDDVEEKNHQVYLMRRIFSQSFANIVWLGESCKRSIQGMNLVAQISDVRNSSHVKTSIEPAILHDWIKSVAWEDVYTIFRRSYWTRLWIIQELALNSHLTLFLCGSQQLPRHAILCATLFCFNDYAKAVSEALSAQRERGKLYISAIPPPSSVETYDSWAVAEHVFRLVELTQGSFTDKRPALDVVLDLARKSSVKDPRDKVYGVLGLLPPLLAEKIVPDYTMARISLYVMFASAFLQQSNTLDQLICWCTATRDTPDTGSNRQMLHRLALNIASRPIYSSSPLRDIMRNTLPSWVPDWTKPFHRRHVQWLRGSQASRELHPQYALSGWNLSCKGIILDVVMTTSFGMSDCAAYRISSERKKNENQDLDNLRSIIESKVPAKHRYVDWSNVSPEKAIHPYRANKDGVQIAVDLVFCMAHPGATLHSYSDIYWIDWNNLDGIYRLSDTYRSPFWSYAMAEMTHPDEFASTSPWEDFDRFRQRNADFDMFGRPFKSCFRDMRSYKPKRWTERSDGEGPAIYSPKDMQEDPQNLTFAHANNVRLATIGFKGRKMATTKTGYLSLVPEEVCKGDIIAVLLGCNFPVALRRFGSGYQYIGECYVAGLMEGQAIELLNRGECQIVDITLR